ncbi:NAD(P)-binding protein [Aspergillus ellipticus CBS 707.79]|uniref:NAD(P)-binding protein n=1 Tax=Aspergillus ellipticus CBS 707.79 TaxID=1448320 RepID=A0A319E2U3_9EURO|nr:NAD(P)-binding protein [Aspergillus ellipticus CBS 707.79]
MYFWKPEHCRHIAILPSSSYAAASPPASNSPLFAARGITFRHANFDDPATLDHAFADVENLFFVSTNTFDNARRRIQHQNVVDAAKKAGVAHVWYTSLAFGGFGSESRAAVQQAHYMTEGMLKESGVTYTSIREGLYTEPFPLFLNWFPDSATLYLPSSSSSGGGGGGEDGGIAFTLRSELGEANAKLLLKGGHENEIVLFTARESITLPQIVAIIHETTGRDVALEFVGSEAYVEKNAAGDVGNKSAAFFEMMVSWYEGIGRGELSVTDGLMAEGTDGAGCGD